MEREPITSAGAQYLRDELKKCMEERPKIIDAISRLRFTFPITNISTKFAIFLLEHSSIYESYILETVSEREYLAKKFLTAGFDVVNSHCNWIHVNDINNNQKIVKIFEA